MAAWEHVVTTAMSVDKYLIVLIAGGWFIFVKQDALLSFSLQSSNCVEGGNVSIPAISLCALRSGVLDMDQPCYGRPWLRAVIDNNKVLEVGSWTCVDSSHSFSPTASSLEEIRSATVLRYSMIPSWSSRLLRNPLLMLNWRRRIGPSSEVGWLYFSPHLRRAKSCATLQGLVGRVWIRSSALFASFRPKIEWCINTV